MSTLRKAVVAAVAAALVVGAPFVGTGTAEAQMKRRPPDMGRGPGPRPGPNRRGDGGGAAAGAAFGILGGLLIGSAIQAEREREAQRQMMYDDAIADCAARFRSYDPETQTYIGRDGRARRCP